MKLDRKKIFAVLIVVLYFCGIGYILVFGPIIFADIPIDHSSPLKPITVDSNNNLVFFKWDYVYDRIFLLKMNEYGRTLVRVEIPFSDWRSGFSGVLDSNDIIHISFNKRVGEAIIDPPTPVGLYYMTIDTNGVILKSQTTILDDNFPSCRSSISMDHAGSIYIFWQDAYKPPSSLHFSKFSSNLSKIIHNRIVAANVTDYLIKSSKTDGVHVLINNLTLPFQDSSR